MARADQYDDPTNYGYDPDQDEEDEYWKKITGGSEAEAADFINRHLGGGSPGDLNRLFAPMAGGASVFTNRPAAGTPGVDPTPPPPPPPPPDPDPDWGGGGWDGGGYGDDWMRATGLLGPAPRYAPPEIPTIDPFSYDPWTAPTFESIKEDPTYLGRKREGEQALLNSRAAQGLVRTGHTLKDLLAYNQDFAGREYGNIFDRDLTRYSTNRGNAFENWRANADVGLRRSGMEQDRAWNMYQPTFDEWAIRGGAGQRAAEFGAGQRRGIDRDIFDRLRWLADFELDAATR